MATKIVVLTGVLSEWQVQSLLTISDSSYFTTALLPSALRSSCHVVKRIQPFLLPMPQRCWEWECSSLNCSFIVLCPRNLHYSSPNPHLTQSPWCNVRASLPWNNTHNITCTGSSELGTCRSRTVQSGQRSCCQSKAHATSAEFNVVLFSILIYLTWKPFPSVEKCWKLVPLPVWRTDITASDFH